MKRKLIINADDLGLSAEIDQGILDLGRRGIVTSATLIVTPSCQTNLNPFFTLEIDLGLHVNLTFGKPCMPISDVPSLIDGAGMFFPDPAKVIAQPHLSDIRKECFKQLERFQELTGRKPAQLSFHKHLHARHPEFFRILLEMALPHNIPVRALNADMRATCRKAEIPTTDFFLGDVKPAPYWTIRRLQEELSQAADGVTELMCHPGLHTRPIPGIWYISERDDEWKTFSSPAAAALLQEASLVNFSDAVSGAQKR